jgi:hypothetical protein
MIFLTGKKTWHDSCLKNSHEATRKVTSKQTGSRPTNKGVNQMELMIVSAGAMSMMAVSLVFQKVAFKKVTVKK